MNVGEGLKYVVWVAGAIVAIPLFFLIVNGKVFLQGHDTVVIRDKGHLRLGPPQPDGSEASADLPFAQLSAAAYEALLKSKDDVTDPPRSNADIGLNAEGWNRWQNFPLPDDQDKFKKYNLRVEVWDNPSLNAIVVAFGGTDPKKLADWFANFRWFIPHHDDEYTQVVKGFQPLFAAEYQQRQGKSDYAFLANAKLYATGHSLGGGLAQEFAYSVPNAPIVPRVTKVYAFDPSPVTGYYSVESGLRDSNKKSLAIDRILPTSGDTGNSSVLHESHSSPERSKPRRQGGSLQPVYRMEPSASAFHKRVERLFSQGCRSSAAEIRQHCNDNQM